MKGAGSITDLLRRRILTRLHVSEIEPGDRLPSIRSVAAELDADHRAVAAAYRALEDEGLVEIRPRSGVYVPEDDAHGSGALSSPTVQWVTEVVLQALNRRIPVTDLPDLFERCTRTARIRCLCIESVEDALDALANEIERDLGLQAIPLLVSEKLTSDDRASIRDRLSGADVVLTTVFHASQVRSLVEETGAENTNGTRSEKRPGTAPDGRNRDGGEGTEEKRTARGRNPFRGDDGTVPVVAVRINAEWMGSFRHALSKGPVTLVVKDPHLEHRLRASLRAEGHGFRVRPVEELEEGLEDLDEDAVVFATPAARAHSGLEELPRLLTNAPLLAVDTAEQLVRLLVWRNVELDACP